MDKNQVIEAIKKAKEASKKRKFVQTYDIIFNLKDIDVKRQENHIDFFTILHYDIKKKIKVCALVGPEMEADVKGNVDQIVFLESFDRFAQDKKLGKKLAEDYDYFIAQASIMPKIAASFGKVFGVRGKMPNPKSGAIVAPKANIKAVVEKLQKTVRMMAKTVPMMQVTVGREDMKDEEVADNIMTLYDQVIHHLPGEVNNLKSVKLKLTMGKPVRLI